jgi:hypothetical protein
MKGLLKYCEAQRMIRALHQRRPSRRLHCRGDTYSLVQVKPSRCQLGKRRSYLRSNLNDARQNRPHTDRGGDTGYGR